MSGTGTDAEELIERARRWAVDDPDPDTAGQLRALVAGGRLDELADAFAGTLAFGTAGLRGRVGPGPNRMNVVVVRRAAAGLAAHLGTGRVVIGYDARHKSDLFARESARVLAGAGLQPLLLDRPLPTPVLAFAVRRLGCAAGIMVTASHNPPQDNGYKVYLDDGVQIAAPSDAAIAAQIERVGEVGDLPLSQEWQVIGEDLVDAYVAEAALVARQGGPRSLSLVSTALHGVGGPMLRRTLLAAGFAAPVPVASQEQPDPDFPGLPFPNPEEPGVMDAALALGMRLGSDAVIANDPDADRCAVAIRSRDAAVLRMLTGDELGALLGWWIIERDRSSGRSPSGVFANSIVSSRLLGRIAAAAGVEHVETLTGFKWIARVPSLRYGYEEAIGYCVAPGAVRDKDGISAAVLAAELLAALRAQDRTAQDVLDELARQHGLHATRQWSVRVQDLATIASCMRRLRAAAPASLAGSPVVEAVDLSLAGPLPPTDALRYVLADRSRVIVRPSGTEPKLKCYLEVIDDVGGDVVAAEERARDRLGALTASLGALTGLG